MEKTAHTPVPHSSAHGPKRLYRWLCEASDNHGGFDASYEAKMSESTYEAIRQTLEQHTAMLRALESVESRLGEELLSDADVVYMVEIARDAIAQAKGVPNG